MAQQRRENYFEMNLKDHDENFINNRSTQDLQRDARKRIFKDMIYGNVDYEVFGKFFTNPNFIDALIATSSVEAQKHFITFQALDQYHRSSGDPVAYNLSVRHRNCAFVLDTIKNDLEMLKNNNYDISFLTQLQSQIMKVPECKRDYSEFY